MTPRTLRCTCGGTPRMEKLGAARRISCPSCGRKTFEFTAETQAVRQWNLGRAWTEEEQRVRRQASVERMLQGRVEASLEDGRIVIRGGTCILGALDSCDARELGARLVELAERAEVS